MRRGSVVGPLILIAVGALFLVNNLRPDMPLMDVVARSWPFLLIGWGVLRLLEIGYQVSRGRALPPAGVGAGEWTLIFFIALFGSGLFWATGRGRWPGIHMRMRGIEMLGEAYDFALPERTVAFTGKPGRVLVENPRGNARISVGTASEVRLSGRKTVRSMSSDQAAEVQKAVEFEVVQEGDTMFVRPSGSARTDRRDDVMVNTDLEITIPQGVRVEARGRRGDFDITGVQADIDIDSDNAGVRLDDVGGNVRVDLRASDIVRASGVKGNVEIRGNGHDIELENIAGQVVVAGNYIGDVQFRGVAKPVRFEGAGRVRDTQFRVEACPGQIRLGHGNLTIENVTGPVNVAAKSNDVQVSEFTQSLDLKVDRGDLDVRAAALPVPRMTLATSAGNVELTLPENGKFSLRAVVDKGEIENEFGELLQAREEGRGGSLTGIVGSGAEVNVRTNRGTVRIRKASPADPPPPPMPPKRPRVPADAAKSIIVQNQ